MSDTRHIARLAAAVLVVVALVSSCATPSHATDDTYTIDTADPAPLVVAARDAMRRTTDTATLCYALVYVSEHVHPVRLHPACTRAVTRDAVHAHHMPTVDRVTPTRAPTRTVTRAPHTLVRDAMRSRDVRRMRARCIAVNADTTVVICAPRRMTLRYVTS